MNYSPVIFDTLLLKKVFKYIFLDIKRSVMSFIHMYFRTKITDIGNDFLFSSY